MGLFNEFDFLCASIANISFVHTLHEANSMTDPLAKFGVDMLYAWWEHLWFGCLPYGEIYVGVLLFYDRSVSWGRVAVCETLLVILCALIVVVLLLRCFYDADCFCVVAALCVAVSSTGPVFYGAVELYGGMVFFHLNICGMGAFSTGVSLSLFAGCVMWVKCKINAYCYVIFRCYMIFLPLSDVFHRLIRVCFVVAMPVVV